jgi:hypothetical protein
MLGTAQYNLASFEHLANGFVGGSDTRLLRHVVGEAASGSTLNRVAPGCEADAGQRTAIALSTLP